jgi:hypothetical protein
LGEAHLGQADARRHEGELSLTARSLPRAAGSSTVTNGPTRSCRSRCCRCSGRS